MLFSSAFPGMFGTFIKYKFQRTYDAILAAPVDTEACATAKALGIGIEHVTEPGHRRLLPRRNLRFASSDVSYGALRDSGSDARSVTE